MKKKHLFFDLDNTVTRSRSVIEPDFKEWFMNFDGDIVIVTGGTHDMIVRQMDGIPCYKLGQSGNHATDVHGEELWKHELTATELEQISDHINSIPITWEVPDKDDLFDNRGCQVAYSLYGHHAPLEDKEAFDPDASIRTAILADHPFVVPGLQVKIGGTTMLDYTAEGKHKGFNVDALVTLMGWSKDECAYFGDRLIPGGNDESVIGVIDTVPVESPADTLAKLQADYS